MPSEWGIMITVDNKTWFVPGITEATIIISIIIALLLMPIIESSVQLVVNTLIQTFIIH